MKILKIIGKFIAKHSIGIAVGLLIFGPIGVFATDNFVLDAEDIEYDGSDSGSAATDVKGALDSLNQKADSCSQATYDSYSVGDTFTLNGDGYHIIDDSGTSQDYVVALKDTAISNTPSSYGSDATYSGSSAKTAVDSWASSTFTDELKEVSGYSARLIEVEELTALGCTSSDCTNSSYSWLYSIEYFTMSQYNNTTTSVWKVSTNGSVGELATASTSLLRPVINVKKSELPSQS